MRPVAVPRTNSGDYFEIMHACPCTAKYAKAPAYTFHYSTLHYLLYVQSFRFPARSLLLQLALEGFKAAVNWNLSVELHAM